MGIKQNYLYRVMPGLAEQGLVAKSGRGWHMREPEPAAEGARPDEPHDGGSRHEGRRPSRRPGRTRRPRQLIAPRRSGDEAQLLDRVALLGELRRDASIRSRENSSISRPCTTVHSPSCVVHGKHEMSPSGTS